jgi:putative transposase
MLFSFGICGEKPRCFNKKEWKGELEKYITGIIQNHRHKMRAIGAMPDHIHILIGYNANQLIPDLVEEIKT